ncbi:hypothetical protein FHR24_000436 [Wenyingzhuangia heitensis]|uniref:Uncharacterized protein n=1 Tax=Wenyingzhuangia heitensis TaxID=1487859 RepID=A0ABX0UA86_9FLAO|nr:hypothetical protein [Wenyingzhuangia heitensis]NIJ43997.1 hypothetical protein [Wenyingzhuangia heitensis]
MKIKIIAFLLALFSMLIFSEGVLFTTLFYVPTILWIFPFYVWFWLSAFYFKNSFGKQLKLYQKIAIILLNSFLLFSFLYVGLQLWKINTGNILMSDNSIFQINLKNIWFWVIYQSYLLLFFFSTFKLLVTIDQK